MSLNRLFFFGLLATFSASAALIPVANPSFETIPVGGLPYVCSGINCVFSNGSVPGWVTSGTNVGQFQPGDPTVNVYYSNPLPDGITLSYLNIGSLSQTTAATVTLGRIYTLTVDVGNRKDLCCSIGSVENLVFLNIGNTSYAATGLLPALGAFSSLSVSYTAQLADVGKSIGITLGPSLVGQVNLDNVRLQDDFLQSAEVPEPTTVAFVAFGLALLGLRRKK